MKVLKGCEVLCARVLDIKLLNLKEDGDERMLQGDIKEE